MAPRTAQLSAIAGAVLLVAATFVPVNGGGEAGYPYALFDRSVQRELLLFAAEPLIVAVAATAVALVLVGRARALAAGLLIAFGVQTLILFLAYLGGAAFGNPLYNSFEPGSVLGVAGALLVLAAGAGIAVTATRQRPGHS